MTSSSLAVHLSALLLLVFLIPSNAQTVALTLSEYEAPTPTPFAISLLTDDPGTISSFVVADGNEDGRIPAGIYFRVSQKVGESVPLYFFIP
ncbi:unnamed protein product [Toxocara canis]|uniref:Cadherin domain-containing protein n=1 Tax=Toxocara canis TaxID=6265 RepID=A0A183U6V8_TOXCA|nr:unnamed protein product [Toxocara canis]